jgi:hypothetical protein
MLRWFLERTEGCCEDEQHIALSREQVGKARHCWNSACFIVTRPKRWPRNLKRQNAVDGEVHGGPH